jgi:hypothetical protein
MRGLNILHKVYADKYPRQVSFGNEAWGLNAGDTPLQQQCDNNGEVLIKGISYKINLRK